MRGITIGLVVCPVVYLVSCGPEPRHGGDGMPCDNCVCTPNTGTCSGNMSHACNDDGSGYTDSYCDPDQGMSCDPNTGQCTGECSPKNLGQSYIGCEYYPTITGNTTGTMFDFAVAIANTTNVDSVVTIEDGALSTPMMVTVPANSVSVQMLPWVAALKLCNTPQTDGCIDGSMTPGALAAKGAYHLRSSHPITVYQFNSLEYVKGGVDSYSNDASLLLPTNVWRTAYYAAAWQQLAGINPSELAVTAWQDGTMVTVTSRADTLAGGGAPAFAANVPQAVTLNAGDVLEMTSKTGDLTGSYFSSNKPVQVISGHYCADIPEGVAACDHLEESMFGVDTLGKRYIVNAPAVTSIPSGKVEVIRIVATQANTNLTYNPPQPGAPTTIAQAGGFVELTGNAASFLIEADQKILVAQYMEGQDAGGGTGDPAMALAVPLEQFRQTYLFHAPTNYESNYVDVTAPMGASVMLDGVPIAFTPIGATGYGFVRVFPLTNGPGNDGSHSMNGDMPFGITVYGYGQYTSYWYPGGLNLLSIIN